MKKAVLILFALVIMLQIRILFLEKRLSSLEHGMFTLVDSIKDLSAASQCNTDSIRIITSMTSPSSPATIDPTFTNGSISTLHVGDKIHIVETRKVGCN